MSKRKLEWDVSEVEESAHATIHGIVTAVSPVKVSRKDSNLHYFDGRLTDGRSSARIVCFDPSLRSALESSREKKEAVSVVNCSVKQNSNKDLEIVGNKHSKVVASPRKYVLPETSTFSDNLEHKTVELRDVDDISCTQRVTVLVKVNSVTEGEVVSTREGVQVRKQDCYVGDSSGCLKT